MPKYFAVVPAAGSGSRFGGEKPKQYLPIAGRPVLFHTLAALCASPRIEHVWVVLAPGDEEWSLNDWRPFGERVSAVRKGGATRADTVLAGLDAVSALAGEDDWVLVHDAARPCLSEKALARLIDELGQDPIGGLLAVPVADTLKRAGADGRVSCTEPRDGLWQAQTPQMFRLGKLRRALRGVMGVTDEAAAMEAAGFAPRLVRGDSANLKVTYPADLALAEWILRSES